MADITNDLLKNINKFHSRQMLKSSTIRALTKKVQNETATMHDAWRYANEIGNIRVKTFKNSLSAEVLPNGRMYYNIAQDVIGKSLEEDYKAVNGFFKAVQTIENRKTTGFKALSPFIDQENVDSIIDMVSAYENFDDIIPTLDKAVKNFARQVVDRGIEANSSFAHDSGYQVVVTRTLDNEKACQWCRDLEGIYVYPNVPKEVFQRHDDCKCEVTYDTRKLTAFERNFGE